MKVYMLRNPAASYNCALQEGETGDVPADLGKQLIADGIAEPAADREKTERAERSEIRGVPDKPAIADAEEPAVANPPAPKDFGKNPHQDKK